MQILVRVAISIFLTIAILIRHHVFIKNLCSHDNGVYFVHCFILYMNKHNKKY
jgi:hypothetical protein